MISRIERGHQRDGKGIEIRCKDYRSLHFSFKHCSQSVADFLNHLSIHLPTTDQSLFAFNYKLAFTQRGYSDDGWGVYQPRGELERILERDENWKMIEQGDRYHLCDTYPPILAFPKAINERELMKIKDFRNEGRAATLSWRNPNQANSLSRCSQPRGGSINARCLEDEKLLFEINRCNQPANERAGDDDGDDDDHHLLDLYLIDARPPSDVVLKPSAPGFEDLSLYKNVKRVFIGVADRQTIREAAEKMHELSLPNEHKKGNANWLSNVESTHWLDQISHLISSSIRIAKLIAQGFNVLVHCSDGADHTSQLTSLAMLLLDPYYRTMEGFMVLIEKEWLGFGHKFKDRCGQVYSEQHQHRWEEETAPVFQQFIESVWQIAQQYPGEFEFNSTMLIFLLDHIHCGFYGTFLGNSDKARKELKVSERTISIWSHILSHRHHFTNPFYIGFDAPFSLPSLHCRCSLRLLSPSPSMKVMKFWGEYYLRYDITIPRCGPDDEYQRWMIDLKQTTHRAEGFQSIYERKTRELSEMVDEIAQMKIEIAKMRRQVEETRMMSPSLELKFERSLYSRLHAELLRLTSRLHP